MKHNFWTKITKENNSFYFPTTTKKKKKKKPADQSYNAKRL